MNDSINMPTVVSRLSTESLSAYLLARGWQQKPSRYENRVFFEGEMHEGGKPYELYLPSSHKVPKYRSLLQRAVYMLCGVEDREPAEVMQDILAESQAVQERSRQDRRRIRVRNAGLSPLQVRIPSRETTHQLLPDESIEVVCEPPNNGTVEIEHTSESITIHGG